MPDPGARYRNQLLEIANAGRAQMGDPMMTMGQVQQNLAGRGMMGAAGRPMAGQASARRDPGAIARRRAELMGQGLTREQALRQMAAEGLINKALVDKILGVVNAVPNY
jgi:hypothetical protein